MTKADVNSVNVAGMSASHRACSDESVEIIKLLLAAGAQLDSQTVKEKQTPLMSAVSSENINAVLQLIASGVKAAIKDANGKTALDFAYDTKHPEIATILQSALQVK